MVVLVVAAHPDDEVLGCGGTIARLAREGHEVHIAILGEGITSRSRTRDEASRVDAEALRARAREVAKLLGGRSLLTQDLPDNRFDTVPLLDVVKVVEEWVGAIRPQVVNTHHSGDLNIDHSVVHRAVLTATRPIAGCDIMEICAFEVPSSSEWAFGQFTKPFQPNVFVDVSETLGLKLRAMRLYETEARPFPHPRSREALRAAALKWGSVAGLKAAEAFELVRSIR